MKAIVFHRYGSPDVLRLEEVAKPVPADDEVLVRVRAASLNPADWHLVRGTPFLAHLAFGLFRPKYTIPGADVAGIVEATGKSITQLKLGDEVFGEVLSSFGSLAEYVCVGEDELVLKPSGISFAEAAAVPLAALTALQGLRKGRIRPGQRVLINGGSGGVGTFSVQLAKSFGAEVTAVCSSGKMDLVRSLGADHIIDYMKDDFTQKTAKYDLILDNVGNRSLSEYKRALDPSGRCVIIGYTSAGRLFQHMVLGPLRSMTGKQKVGLMGTAQMDTEDLSFLASLLEEGKLKPVIERNCSLDEVPGALAYLEEGHARGKIVVTL